MSPLKYPDVSARIEDIKKELAQPRFNELRTYEELQDAHSSDPDNMLSAEVEALYLYKQIEELEKHADEKDRTKSPSYLFTPYFLSLSADYGYDVDYIENYII